MAKLAAFLTLLAHWYVRFVFAPRLRSLILRSRSMSVVTAPVWTVVNDGKKNTSSERRAEVRAASETNA